MTTISAGINGPYGIAVTPNGFYAYAANGDKTIKVINTATNMVIDTVPLGVNLNQIAITPNGLYVYVTCHGADIVSVVETTKNTVLTTIGVGNQPYGIAITSDGLYAYAANVDTVSVINTTSNAVIDTIKSLGSILAIAINPVKIPIPPTNAPTSTPTRVPTKSPTASTEGPTSAPTTGNNTGLIVGLSFGTVGFIVVVGVGVYLILKKEDPSSRGELSESTESPREAPSGSTKPLGEEPSESTESPREESSGSTEPLRKEPSEITALVVNDYSVKPLGSSRMHITNYG